MTRARRLRAGRGLAASLVATAALAVAPAASAADCPNEAVRAQQQSQHLPNCMAYEKVTPADKNGAAPGISEVIVADGNRLLFGMNSGVGDTQGFLTGNYRATRTDAGWTFNSMTPPFNRIPPVLVDSAEFAGWSSDLERVALGTRYPVSPNDRGQQANGTRILDVYIREEDGSFTWVVPDPSVPDTSTHPVTYAGGSPDLDRVVVATARPFDDRVGTTTAQHLYVWTRTGMNLATVLPNGTVPTAMSASGGRAVSADGRRIAFTTGSGADLRVYVRYNADDPASAYTREVAVGPNGEACDSGGSSQLAGLSPDGSKLLFSCRSAILPGAPAEGVYLRDLDGGPDAVRLVGAGAATPPYGSNADYSRIYVSGLGPAFGTVALIRDGVPEQAVPSTVASGTQTTIFRSDVSSDGEHLVIQSAWDFGLSGVDAGTGDDFQVYAFSARTGEFGCVSCRQDGAPTNGSGELRGSIGNVFSRNMITPLTDNGRVAFVTPVGLDPRDTNGLQDAYAWIDGRQVLLSSGRSGEPATAQGASRDGRSFFFSTGEAMVPDDRDGGAYDIYVAREGGGFLLPDSPVECTANCQAPAPSVPGLPNVSTPTFLGRGNVPAPLATDEKPSSDAEDAEASISASKSVRGSRTTVRVRVSRPGKLRVSGVGLRRMTKTVKKAGTYRVTVRLSSYGLRKQRQRGRLATRVTVRLTPESGSSVKARKSIRFTATKKGGR